MGNKVSPYKGRLVHVRHTWGEHRGQVAEQELFIVRSCGPKMAILDRVDSKTLVKNGWRGQTFYLHNRDEAERANRDGRSFYYWDWSQFFVPQGEAGWDPDQNF